MYRLHLQLVYRMEGLKKDKVAAILNYTDLLYNYYNNDIIIALMLFSTLW